MTKKATLSFKSATVFDKKFKPDIETCSCVVSKMFFAGKLNMDGTVNKDNVSSLRKYELWSYIYYLFYYNNSSIPEFAEMKAKSIGGDLKASAMAFYIVVHNAVERKNSAVITVDSKVPLIIPFDIQTLAYFVELMIAKYAVEGDHPKLMNPIIDFVRALVHKSQMVVEDRMSQIVVKTGNNNVKIVQGSDPSVTDADIKVNIRPVGGARTTVRASEARASARTSEALGGASARTKATKGPAKKKLSGRKN